MTTDEVARYLRVSKASIYRLVKDREIPVSKIGRHLRFRKDVIDEWLLEKERMHVTPPH
ncbi:MAG: DNA-binding protein [Deltaproteobacteria bacterium]|nr:MAG: DNA-binding protein [Deltaproteobacteria bacterium]